MTTPYQPDPNRVQRHDNDQGPIELAPVAGPARPLPAQPAVVQTVQVKPIAGPVVDVKRSAPFRALGLMLLLAGVAFGRMTDAQWDSLIDSIRMEQSGSLRSETAPATAASVPAVSESATTTSAPASGWREKLSRASSLLTDELRVRWRWLGIAAVLIGLAGVCIGGRSAPPFFVSLILFVGVGFVVTGLMSPKINQFLGAMPSSFMIVVISAALAYLVHALGFVQYPRVMPIVGLILTTVAGAGVLLNWFEYPAAANEAWRHEITWGVVLLLTIIGVITSRGPVIQFLNALLLASLAYYCIHEGMLRVFPFPGTDWPPIALRDIDHVATWRWVLTGELILLSGILLHLSLGVGGLTMAVALIWLSCGLYVDREWGREVLLTYTQAVEMTTPRHTHHADGDDPVRSRLREPVPGHRHQPADLFPMLTPPDQAASRPVYTPEQRSRLLRKAQGRIAIVYAWLYLTAILAGVLGACALRMLIHSATRRLWMVGVIWFVFGGVAFWLYSIWPSIETWSSLVVAFILPKSHVYALLLTALGSMALVSGWSLNGRSRYSTWLFTAATVSFLGTVLTLVCIAMLIKLTGYGSFQVWAYAAIAFGQSALMWILLIHHSDRVRRGVAIETAMA